MVKQSDKPHLAVTKRISTGTLALTLLTLGSCVSVTRVQAQMNIRVRGVGIDIRNTKGNADKQGRAQIYPIPERTAWELDRYMTPGKFYIFDQRPNAIKNKDYATTPIASGYDKEDSRTDYALDAFKADAKGTVTIAVPTDKLSAAGWKKSNTSFKTTITDFTLYTYDYKQAGQWVDIPKPNPKVPTLLFADKGHLKFDNPLPISDLAEAVLIANARGYIVDPDMIIMPNGDYIASARGGPLNKKIFVRLWKSTDKGKTWKPLNTENTFVRHATLLYHKGALYLFGDKTDGYGAIEKSNDGGETWPEDVTLPFKFRTAPSHVVTAKGRYWIATEYAHGSSTFSAPIDSDLMNPKSWTLAKRQDSIDTGNESDIVATHNDGYPIIMPKWDTQIRVLNPNETMADKEIDKMSLPGNGSKYSAIYDPISDKYWALTSFSTLPNNIRTGIALFSSDDLKTFKFERQVMTGKSSSFHGFNYPFMQIDGDDVVFVLRTSWENEDGQAQRWHDANMFTFHRVRDFRKN